MYKVYYSKEFGQFGFGFGSSGKKLPTIEGLKTSHKLVCELSETDDKRILISIPYDIPVAITPSGSLPSRLEGLDLVFYFMQGEIWSAHGEARKLIEHIGVQHTSMSVGDIIEVDGKYHMVAGHGFKELK